MHQGSEHTGHAPAQVLSLLGCLVVRPWPRVPITNHHHVEGAARWPTHRISVCATASRKLTVFDCCFLGLPRRSCVPNTHHHRPTDHQRIANGVNGSPCEHSDAQQVSDTRHMRQSSSFPFWKDMQEVTHQVGHFPIPCYALVGHFRVRAFAEHPPSPFRGSGAIAESSRPSSLAWSPTMPVS